MHCASQLVALEQLSWCFYLHHWQSKFRWSHNNTKIKLKQMPVGNSEKKGKKNRTYLFQYCRRVWSADIKITNPSNFLQWKLLIMRWFFWSGSALMRIFILVGDTARWHQKMGAGRNNEQGDNEGKGDTEKSTLNVINWPCNVFHWCTLFLSVSTVCLYMWANRHVFSEIKRIYMLFFLFMVYLFGYIFLTLLFKSFGSLSYNISTVMSLLKT